jgi:glycine cleavage system H protein
VNGEVISLNNNISTDPALLNKEAEKSGWLFKIKVENERDMSNNCFSL